MFVTTPKEKELLRKAELYLIGSLDSPKRDSGLCRALAYSVRPANSPVITTLKYKIRDVLGRHTYLPTYVWMLNSDLPLNNQYWNLDYPARCKLVLYLRLVWINKLLNYTGE
jgi:hypothetical protein